MVGPGRTLGGAARNGFGRGAAARRHRTGGDRPARTAGGGRAHRKRRSGHGFPADASVRRTEPAGHHGAGRDARPAADVAGAVGANDAAGARPVGHWRHAGYRRAAARRADGFMIPRFPLGATEELLPALSAFSVLPMLIGIMVLDRKRTRL